MMGFRYASYESWPLSPWLLVRGKREMAAEAVEPSQYQRCHLRGRGEGAVALAYLSWI